MFQTIQTFDSVHACEEMPFSFEGANTINFQLLSFPLVFCLDQETFFGQTPIARCQKIIWQLEKKQQVKFIVPIEQKCLSSFFRMLQSNS